MKRGFVVAISGFVLLALVVIVQPATIAFAQDSTQAASTVSRPVVTTAAPATGKAKNPASKGGVTISPAFQQISIDTSKPSLTYDFSVTNNSSEPYEFALSVVDFGSLDDTGGVLFIGNAQKALSYRYALSPWVTLEKDRIVVDPHATEKVPITIVNKESLTPGGHYGAVLVTPTESAAGENSKVQIDQVASSLLFVKKLGGEVYKLNLDKFTVRPHIFSLPGTADIRFQNAGNVHVVPRGMVTLTDPRGRIVKRGPINADSGIVLPESFHRFNIPLQSVAASPLPGRYKLTATYRYDDIAATKTIETSFLYFSVPSIAVGLVLVAAAATLICSRKLRHMIVVKSRHIARLAHRLPMTLRRRK
jgi:hypothetical protein